MNEYLYEITKDLPDDEWYEIRKRKRKVIITIMQKWRMNYGTHKSH